MQEKLNYEYFLIGVKLEELDEVLSDLELEYDKLIVMEDTPTLAFTTSNALVYLLILHKNGIVTESRLIKVNKE